MEFLKLLRTETNINLRRMIGMAVIAGISNALVLALINSAADPVAQKAGQTRMAILFLLVVLTYTVSQRYLMFEAAKEIELVIHRIRSRLIESVRASELLDIERIGRTQIFNGISKEIQSLAQSTNILVAVGQMAILVVFATFYLMFLSFTAFLLAAVFMAVAISIYLGRLKIVNKAVHDATVAEYGLHELLTGILDGFKELKLNAIRSQAISDDIVDNSLDAATERVKAQSEFARNYVFTQNVFFLLLGTMVFLVPALTTTYSDVIVKTTTAVLFVIGPIGGVVASVPTFINANASASNIRALERLLAKPDAIDPGYAAEVQAATIPSFKTLELRDLSYRFPGSLTEHPFRVGPINLTVTAGELIFISGGNGSGKSTIMRLLTSLYWPQEGMILVDGRPVTHENVESYRALFSTVFSDYHLFKRLYAVKPEAIAEAAELLHLLEIEDKTSLVGDTFTTIELSQGQKKRLALVVAMMERRPICILDEWAADQDPIFRRKFYVELLPMMKARGTTVIAVTHDDRYFELADRRLHIEEGKIVSEQRGTGHV